MSVVTTYKPSVLIVDDVEANLVALEAQLSKLDCQLIRANSGNEALRQLLLHKFAVMLLDVQMPGMDGFEVARYARENPETKDIPIIFVTAMHETDENTLRGYGAGAVDFLFKPVNPDILHSKVKVFIELFLNQKKLADEIEAHKQTLADLESFNYSVSHDLRNPLGPIQTYAQLILDDYGKDLPSKPKEYLERIHLSAKKMAQLIEDLLRFSRLGTAELNSTQVDLTMIAESILTELRFHENSRKVEFSSIKDAQDSGDSALLRVAFENLLRNAWKFTQKKEVAKIEFGVEMQNGKRVYYIRDNGAGFSEQKAQKLFQPFQRLHSESEFKGTGIGLAIVKRVIERHKGRIWAKSSIGEGTTFFFTLNEAQ